MPTALFSRAGKAFCLPRPQRIFAVPASSDRVLRDMSDLSQAFDLVATDSNRVKAGLYLVTFLGRQRIQLSAKTS